MRAYLLTTGIGAIIALAFPPLVYCGLFFFVLPGIFLMMSPLLFAYGLGAWIISKVLLGIASLGGLSAKRLPVRLGIGAASIAVALGAGFLVPQILNAPAQALASRLQSSDVEVAGPIQLADTVAIVLPDGSYSSDDLCETLCQRLLYNRAAKRVVVDLEPEPGSKKANKLPRVFTVEWRDHCPPPPLSKREIFWPGDAGLSSAQRVRARIGAGECLVEAPTATDEPELTIAYRIVDDRWSALTEPWALPRDAIGANRVEIVSRGEALYRKTEVEVGLLFAPLIVNSGSSFLTTARFFGWARATELRSEIDVNGRKALHTVLGEAARAPDLPTLRGPK